MDRSRAERRMAEATATQAAHEAAKLSMRTKVPIAIIAARTGLAIETIAARRELLDLQRRVKSE